MYRKIAFLLVFTVTSSFAAEEQKTVGSERAIELANTDSFFDHNRLEFGFGSGVKWEQFQNDKSRISVPFKLSLNIAKAVELKFDAKTYWKQAEKAAEYGLKDFKFGAAYNMVNLDDIGFATVVGASIGSKTSANPSVLVYSSEVAFKQKVTNDFGIQLAADFEVEAKDKHEISAGIVLAPFAKFGDFGAVIEGVASIDNEAEIGYSVVPGLNWYPGKGYKLGLHAGFGLNSNALDKYSVSFSFGHVINIG